MEDGMRATDRFNDQLTERSACTKLHTDADQPHFDRALEGENGRTALETSHMYPSNNPTDLTFESVQVEPRIKHQSIKHMYKTIDP